MSSERSANIVVNIVVDAGGLIAAERGNPRLGTMDLFNPAIQLLVPACVVAQVWRNGRRQAKLARFLGSCEIVGVADDAGPRLGMLLGSAGTCDVVDATVVDLARKRNAGGIVTSDPDDISRLARAAKLPVPIMVI